MINIQWDKKFELGHERIDFEHRIFLDLIKSVSELASEKERALRLLREVEKYAEFHFISEENLMLDTEYPDYSSHKTEHQILLATLKEKVFEYRHNQLSLEELSDFLFQWFALHTTQVDSQLTQYISR